MEKLHYLGLLFLNFVVLNALLSFISFLLSIAGKRFLASPLSKRRLFFVSLVAPPALSALTIFTSFIPPLFVKIPGRTMFCVNEPYCYIFSIISPEIPLFHALLLTSLGLVLIPVIYAGAGIRSYRRICAEIDKLSACFNPASKAGQDCPAYRNGGKAGVENPAYPDRRGFRSAALTAGLTPPENVVINEGAWEELRTFERVHNLRVKIIDTPDRISLLWGYFSNTLILSIGVLQTLSIEELQCLLAHELSHYRRRDNILKGILLLCRNSLFPFPHVYYLFRWWREEIELTGDEQAAVTTGRPLDVASALIKMMNPAAENPSPLKKGGLDLGPYAIGFSLQKESNLLSDRVERLVAIHDRRIKVGHGRPSILPSETGLLISMASLFPLFFIAIYELNPLLVHCYLENLLTLL